MLAGRKTLEMQNSSLTIDLSKEDEVGYHGSD
jgi:hypothetical protein